MGHHSVRRFDLYGDGVCITRKLILLPKHKEHLLRGRSL
jgi:hypothetical protein